MHGGYIVWLTGATPAKSIWREGAGSGVKLAEKAADLNFGGVCIVWVVHVQIDIPTHTCKSTQPVHPLHKFLLERDLSCTASRLSRALPCESSGRVLSNKMNVHSAQGNRHSPQQEQVVSCHITVDTDGIDAEVMVSIALLCSSLTQVSCMAYSSCNKQKANYISSLHLGHGQGSARVTSSHLQGERL